MKRKATTHLFIGIGLILALLSIPASGALTATHIERASQAAVVSDATAMLGLNGFSGANHNFKNKNNSYTEVGTISNNAKLNIKLLIKVTPTFEFVSNVDLGIKFGSTELILSNNAPQTTEIFLNSGDTAIVSAYLTKANAAGNNGQGQGQGANKSQTVTATFDFQAVDVNTGQTVYYVNHTPASPRMMQFNN